MKSLTLQLPHYTQLQESYAQWLDITGYALTTVESLPIHIRELLHYLEKIKIHHITQATEIHIYNFIEYLKHRTNLNTGAGLSASMINKTITAISIFAHYLDLTSKHTLELNLEREETGIFEPTILTKEEIKALYNATFAPSYSTSPAINQRDRAIIAVFYGCGLRRNEGIQLNTEDILKDQSLILVRKGKGNKERLVPIAQQHKEDLLTYLYDARPWFMECHAQYNHNRRIPQKRDCNKNAFFLNIRGQRMSEGLYNRLIQLTQKASIEKSFGLHILRHSIATHLLESGMDIEEIRKFLGHQSLASTQIYTHINHNHNKYH